LATQIVYGGCDFETAEYYSKASGTTTADANPDPVKANFRQRPLLTADEVITPLDGNCTLFARYVDAAYATQIVLTAQLTRLYERVDWKRRITVAKDNEPMILTRTRPSQPISTTSTDAPATGNGVPDPPAAPQPSAANGARDPEATNQVQADEILTAKVDQVMDKAVSRKFSASRYKNATRATQGRK
jgi:hypothetical protein